MIPLILLITIWRRMSIISSSCIERVTVGSARWVLWLLLMCRGSDGRHLVHVHHFIHGLPVLSASVYLSLVQCLTHCLVFGTKWSLLANWKLKWAPSSTRPAFMPLLVTWRPLHHVQRGALPHNLGFGNFSLLITWTDLVCRPVVGVSWIPALCVQSCRSLTASDRVKLLLVPVNIGSIVWIVNIRSCWIPRIQSHIFRIWISLVGLSCSLSICSRSWDIVAMAWLGVTCWMANWWITRLLTSLPLISRIKTSWIMHLSIFLSEF